MVRYSKYFRDFFHVYIHVFLIFNLLGSFTVSAQPPLRHQIHVIPKSFVPKNLNNAVQSGIHRSRSGIIQTYHDLHLIHSCSKVNLRQVSNPLQNGASHSITFTASLSDKKVSIVYEIDMRNSWSVKNVRVGPDNTLNGIRIRHNGNSKIIILRVPVTARSLASIDPDGTYHEEIQATPIEGYSFFREGGISTQSTRNLSSDGQLTEIHMNFFGTACGGYYSPLMLFFGHQRPTFTGTQNKILLGSSASYWPEKKAPGFFLALDKNKDGKITEKRELFGEEKGKFKNGFDALSIYDKNKDGKIDLQDPIFHKLLLWKDKNSNALSEKEELWKASEKIISISLKYEKNRITPFGKRANAKERAFFHYKKGKRTLAGNIVDIWFQPVSEE